jgi:hypothetical protein
MGGGTRKMTFKAALDGSLAARLWLVKLLLTLAMLI